MKKRTRKKLRKQRESVPQLIPIGDLRETFFVRRNLDEDRVIQLAALYKAKADIPPLEISPNLEIIDGRHRYAALKLIKAKHASCIMNSETDRGRLLMRALTLNMGGSQPPTQDDITFSIEKMIEAGVSRAEIRETLPLPQMIANRYLDDVQSKLHRRKVSRALESMAEKNLTVTEAAEAQKLAPERLKEAIGRKKRSAKAASASPTSAIALIRALSQRYTTFSHSNAGLLKKLLVAVDDGEMTTAEAQKVVRHAQTLTNRMKLNLANWHLRVATPQE